MKGRRNLFNIQWLFLAITFFLIAVTLPTEAIDPPTTYNDIKALLPDSTILKNKVVYVDFWASWCGPCRKSFPWMQQMYDDYHNKGLEIVAVNLDKKKQSADKFLSQNNASFPVVYDPTASLAKKYGIDAIPSSFIFGRDGKLVSVHRGFKPDEADSLEFAIEDLLLGGKSK